MSANAADEMGELAMTETTAPARPATPERSRRTGLTTQTILLALLPLLLLGAVIVLIVRTDAGLGDRAVPPIETLSFQRVRLPAPGLIEVQIVNDGPDPVTVAQVLVDEAYWTFTMTPNRPLERLETATISITYPWVQGESHAIA